MYSISTFINFDPNLTLTHFKTILNFVKLVSSPEPKAHKLSLCYIPIEPWVNASVGPSDRPFTLSNINIPTTSRPIAAKFYLKHHWDGGKDA